MRDLPILMNSAMVRALLRDENPKTQTRRVVKGMALDWLQPGMFSPEYVASADSLLSPYGFAGDLLWVRETFIAFGRWETRFSEKKGRDEWHFVDMTLETGREYRFGGELPNAKRAGATPAWWKRPSIHMPRAASRITLEVTDVRIERLQDISETDARAEGCPFTWDGKQYDPPPPEVDSWQGYGRASFSLLWTQINGPDSWYANPFVWVVEFKRIEA
ncbi:hypothetical protein [Paraburkholderia sp. RL17-373-BIF-A]|uniref:hypothetical protein n=1 Tax=Paraburkholderia sp. RL17-373-BIF-A TaxID=3031629 RepID=UPI0038BBECEE